VNKKTPQPAPTEYRLAATGSFLDLLMDPENHPPIEARLEPIPPDQKLRGAK